jgi:hypothetical protein
MKSSGVEVNRHLPHISSCRDFGESTMSNLMQFVFETKEIRVVADEQGEPLFVSKDVAEALGIESDVFVKSFLSCTDALFCYRYIEDGRLQNRAFKWVVEVSKIGFNQESYSLFSEAYLSAVMFLAQASRTSEATVMSIFAENVGSYIDGAKMTSGPSSILNQPDAWIELASGETCPVEGKYTVADSKALKQLLRYMKAFCRKTGVLVAQELKTPIPQNVIFVKVDL